MSRKCNKRCFTPHQAEAAIEKARKSKSEHRHEKRAYHCKIHDCFHLTSQDPHENGPENLIILKHGKEFKKFLE